MFCKYQALVAQKQAASGSSRCSRGAAALDAVIVPRQTFAALALGAAVAVGCWRAEGRGFEVNIYLLFFVVVVVLLLLLLLLLPLLFFSFLLLRAARAVRKTEVNTSAVFAFAVRVGALRVVTAGVANVQLAEPVVTGRTALFLRTQAPQPARARCTLAVPGAC